MIDLDKLQQAAALVQSEVLPISIIRSDEVLAAIAELRAARAVVDAYRQMYPKHDLIRRYDEATKEKE